MNTAVFNSRFSNPSAAEGTGKDLFAAAFSELSSFDSDTYDVEFVERLPFLILNIAAESNPALQNIEGFGEAQEFLCAESRNHVANPELYSHLLRIQDPR